MSSSPARVSSGNKFPAENELTDLTGDAWEEASAPQKIEWLLEPQGDHGKWGWVVYRTSYKPELDVAWETLKQLILNQSRDDIACSEVPHLVEKMDWMFVEDAVTLEGASREELRRQFQTFAHAKMSRFLEEDRHGSGVDSRYEVFLQADEDALLSVLRDPVPVGRVGGHVNMVKGWLLEPPPELRADKSEEPEDLEDWMKVMVGLVRPESYVEMYDPENWYLFYQEPPHVWNF